MGPSTCKSSLTNAKPFPGQDAIQPTPAPVENKPTPGPDGNLAPGNESVDGWVSVVYSLFWKPASWCFQILSTMWKNNCNNKKEYSCSLNGHSFPLTFRTILTRNCD